MAKQYVPEGVWLACDKGTAPSTLRVSNNENTTIYGSAMATEADLKPFFNIKKMGLCTVKGGCVPMVKQWDDAQEGVMINGNKMLKEDSTCKCGFGGKITIHFDKQSAAAACAFGEIKKPTEYITEGFDWAAEQNEKNRKERDENIPGWMASILHVDDWYEDAKSALAEGAVTGVIGTGEMLYDVWQDPVGTAEALGDMAVGAYTVAKAGVKDAYNWASEGENWENTYNSTKDWVSDSQNWKDAVNAGWDNTKKAAVFVAENPRKIFKPLGELIPDVVVGLFTGGSSVAAKTIVKEGAEATLEKKLLMETVGEALQQAEKKIGKVVVKDAKEELAEKAEKKLAEEAALEKRTFKSDPVDMATGEMFIEDIGFNLPGIIPIIWKTVWFNSSTYKGQLGSGWGHSYDQFLKINNNENKIIYRTADNRDIAFPHLTEEGASYYKRSEKTTFYRQNNGYKLFNHEEQLQYLFEYNSVAEKYVLKGIYNADGAAIKFEYKNGLLTKIIDSCQRVLTVINNEFGQIIQINLLPEKKSLLPEETLIKYEYNEQHCLTKISYPLGLAQHFYYNVHKQVIKRTLRSGINFYFEYDGIGPKAKCPRTWGDGNVLGYHFTFEKEKTISVNSLGDATTYFHKNGLIIKTIDPYGNITYNKYNEYNELITQTDALNNTTVYTYDEKGNLTNTFLPNGAIINVVYNKQGLPKQATDADGGKWQWEYDEAGHLIKQINPLQQVTSYKYENGLLTSLTDALGSTTLFFYNNKGQLIQAQSSNGESTQWQYNYKGFCTATLYANGTVQRIHYNAAGNIEKIEEPDGNVKHITYNIAGKPIQAKDNNSNIVFEYDNTGKLISRSEGGQKIKFAYDTELNLTTVINEEGSRYVFELDANGQIIVETGFDGLTRHYQRNKAGQVTKVERPGERSTQYQYNNLGQVIAAKYHDDSVETYNYSPGGKLLTAANAESTVDFTYDAFGQVLTETTAKATINNKYNELGQRIELTSTLGAHIQLQRNIMGDIMQMTAGNWQASIRRSSEGWETARLLPGNVESSWKMDGAGRPIAHDVFNFQTFKSSRQKRYTWGANNRLHEIWDSMHNDKTSFVHDTRGRLTAAGHTDGTYEIRSADAVGNLFESKNHKDRKYAQGGRLTEKNGTKYAYDQEGNLIQKKEKNGDVWAYEWNAAGMLQKVIRPDKTTVTFGYDALGRRIWKKYKQTITKFVWDGNTILHEWKEFDAKESTPDDLITWVFEEDSFAPAAKLKGNKKYSIITDHLGTPVQGFTGDGVLVWERELDIYGKVKILKGEEGFCNYLYQGQTLDAETGLAYNRFRYYAPDEGMYISQDPIGLASGEFNLYNYVKDTNSWLDLFGLTPKSPRVQALPEALQTRPKWRKSTIDYLKENSPMKNGKYIDVKTGKVIEGKNVIGHQNESWKEYQDNPANHNKTRAQVINDYNNVDNLGYEDATQSAIDGGKFKGNENC
jgi:RHS repeat-associated protein